MALKTINIGHLYPAEMNIYGDNGNVLTLVWRLTQRGYQPKVHRIEIGSNLPSNLDILLGGGGQDSGQDKIKDDLIRQNDELKAQAKDGLVILAVCGTYQLLGHYFDTASGDRLPGIGLFDAFTKAESKRLIGNIVVSSPFGRLVGFENHSGQTHLNPGQLPLGRVERGSGNDESSGKEGAVTANAFGTYLHGPLLPKNPHLADELLKRAIERRYGEAKLTPLDDAWALRAAEVAARRP